MPLGSLDTIQKRMIYSNLNITYSFGFQNCRYIAKASLWNSHSADKCLRWPESCLFPRPPA